MILYEEFRLINKEVLDSVIRPFSYIRPVPYLINPEYSHLGEEPREIFISSASHQGLWWFEETKKNILAMMRGESAGFIAIDFFAAVHHKIKSYKSIKKDMASMDEITALEEYENVPWGESSDAYYKLSMFTKSRNVEKAFYPQRMETYNAKKNPYGIPKVDGEIRLISCDVALRNSSRNDLSITSCVRLIPTKRGYYRELCYMEGFSGENTITQALRIKQVFHDFEADVIVFDATTPGLGILDNLGVITKDAERGVEYPAYTIMQHSSIDDSKYQELLNRTLAVNAKPVIYPVNATMQLNSAIAGAMRDSLQKKMWKFLIDETGAEDYLSKTNKEIFVSDDMGAKSFFMAPYVMTTLFINESVNLSASFNLGNVKLMEPSGQRKDKYTSVSYANYYASFLDRDLLREEDGGDDWDALLGSLYFG